MSDGDAVLTGKEIVETRFVQRVTAAGLVKAKASKTEKDHDEMMRRLVEFLAYLSLPSLDTLADQVLDAATGSKRDQWPSEVVIRQMAEGLERRPVEEKPIVTSWLASIEGPKAEAGGYLAELFRHLRVNPRPVLVYDLTVIKRQAEENRREKSLIDQRQRDGMDRPEDRAWLVEYQSDLSRALTIVERGKAARTEKNQTRDVA